MTRAMPLTILLAVVALTLAIAPARAAASLTAGDIYLALGDSLTTGTEAAANNDGLPGYPSFLSDLLRPTTPLTYTLQGVSGETTTSMLAEGGQLDDAVAYIGAQRQAGNEVGLVTLSIGGNDIVSVLRGQSGGRTITDTLTLMRTNLGQILDELIAASTVDGQRRARIVVQNYYNPYPGVTIRDTPPFIDLPDGQEPIVTDRDLPKFNQMLAEVAVARCIAVVDAFGVVRGNEPAYLFVQYPVSPLNGEAGLDYHPREAGHRALAAATQARLAQPDCQRAYLPALALPTR